MTHTHTHGHGHATGITESTAVELPDRRVTYLGDDDNKGTKEEKEHDVDKDLEMHNMLHFLATEEEGAYGTHMKIPEDSTTNSDIHGTVGAGTGNDTKTWRDRNKAMSKYDDDDLMFRKKPASKNADRFFNGSGRRPRRRC